MGGCNPDKTDEGGRLDGCYNGQGGRHFPLTLRGSCRFATVMSKWPKTFFLYEDKPKLFFLPNLKISVSKHP